MEKPHGTREKGVNSSKFIHQSRSQVYHAGKSFCISDYHLACSRLWCSLTFGRSYRSSTISSMYWEQRWHLYFAAQPALLFSKLDTIKTHTYMSHVDICPYLSTFVYTCLNNCLVVSCCFWVSSHIFVIATDCKSAGTAWTLRPGCRWL